MLNLIELGWVFIYIFAFGISNLFVKKFIKTDTMYIFYFICIGLIGLFIISYNT